MICRYFYRPKVSLFPLRIPIVIEHLAVEQNENELLLLYGAHLLTIQATGAYLLSFFYSLFIREWMVYISTCPSVLLQSIYLCFTVSASSVCNRHCLLLILDFPVIEDPDFFIRSPVQTVFNICYKHPGGQVRYMFLDLFPQLQRLFRVHKELIEFEISANSHSELQKTLQNLHEFQIWTICDSLLTLLLL